MNVFIPKCEIGLRWLVSIQKTGNRMSHTIKAVLYFRVHKTRKSFWAHLNTRLFASWFCTRNKQLACIIHIAATLSFLLTANRNRKISIMFVFTWYWIRYIYGHTFIYMVTSQPKNAYCAYCQFIKHAKAEIKRKIFNSTYLSYMNSYLLST